MPCTFRNSDENYNGQSDQLQAIRDAVGVLKLAGAPGGVGLYGHIPFCFHKCHYCDFYSIVDAEDRQQAFTERMIGEIEAFADAGAPPVNTIFFGGGTPTLLQPILWAKLLHSLNARFDLTALVEFTVEANPETVTAELLDILVAGGVNRLSIGSQSFNQTHLKTLERWHDPQNVARSVQLARAAGIDNVNLDLIFAIPGQSLDQWATDLEQALSLKPEHLSCYSLTYEPGTAMTVKLQRGRITPAEEDLEAAMFTHTIDCLTAAGFDHYEISNFARRLEPFSRRACPPLKHTVDPSGGQARRLNNRCQHNLMYWQNGSWLAIGPSASGHLSGIRWKNTPHLGKYLASASGGAPIQDVERLAAEASVGEQLMLRLRLIEGVEHAWLASHLTPDTGNDLANPSRRDTIDRFIADGLLESTPTHLRLTRRGLMLADSIVAELL
ncbi:radical SAM family heme chaperone HemW [Planctomycetales bacterium ZRK34]|nr:radical SAM family heme chaperone HemW [Planctomycetales bacterium ZRK34]